ncbi:MAG: hypothetical protein ACLU94_10250 [Catenibacillus sp.]
MKAWLLLTSLPDCGAASNTNIGGEYRNVWLMAFTPLFIKNSSLSRSKYNCILSVKLPPSVDVCHNGDQAQFWGARLSNAVAARESAAGWYLPVYFGVNNW